MENQLSQIKRSRWLHYRYMSNAKMRQEFERNKACSNNRTELIGSMDQEKKGTKYRENIAKI